MSNGSLFGKTDPGRVRTNNEDVFIAEKLTGGHYQLAAVIDGVGGYEGGEIAAALTREVILAELGSIGADIQGQLYLAMRIANEEVLAKKLENAQWSQMACVATVVVTDSENHMFHYIHVGDTRLYLFRDRSLIKITHDQSQVGFLEDSGRLSEAAAMQHPRRNQINQALGLQSLDAEAEDYFECGTSPFLPGDLLLVCSDGLTDMIDRQAISGVLSSEGTLAVKAEQLVSLANQAGGKDNVTVVLAASVKEAPSADQRDAAAVVSPVFEQGAAPVTVTPPHPSRDTKVTGNYRSGISRRWLILLVTLGFCLAISALWFCLAPGGSKQLAGAGPAKQQAAPLSPQERQLTLLLSSLKGDTLNIPAGKFSGPVILTRPLLINRDSLVINPAAGLVLQSAPSYHGPALILGQGCKYISIRQLVIKGFDTGISSFQNSADLKNVQFENCKNALVVVFAFGNRSFVNGRVSKRSFQTDSVRKKSL